MMDVEQELRFLRKMDEQTRLLSGMVEAEKERSDALLARLIEATRLIQIARMYMSSYAVRSAADKAGIKPSVIEWMVRSDNFVEGSKIKKNNSARAEEVANG